MTVNQYSTPPLAVVAAIILKNGKILITQRPENKNQGNFWEFPGGKIEPEESPQQALRRELTEELDINIAVGPLVATVLHQYEWGRVEIQAYLCDWLDGQIKHIDVKDHCWVDPADLFNHNILPADIPIIEKLQALNFA